MDQLIFDTSNTTTKTRSSSDGDLGSFCGSVERVVHFNATTGQCLLDVKIDSFKTHFMLTGYVPSVFPGQGFRAQVGEKIREGDEKIFTALTLEITAPISERTLRKFLKSEAMLDLGKTVSKSLAAAFPENLFSILDLNPARLNEVPGIGPKRRLQILDSWERFKTLADFKSLLFEEGLPLEWADTLWPFYGVESLKAFRESPYSLALEHRLSFDLIDSYALRRGFPLQSEERIRCALHDLLQNAYKQGHCAFPEKDLLQEAQLKLGVYPESIASALELELIENKFAEDRIQETPCIYLHDVWQMERNVGRRLLKFLDQDPPWGWFNLEKVLSWAQSLLNIQLAPLQKDAIQTALSSSLTVITGGPGTGKTTLIRSLTAILQTQHLKFALCSPTGRAAKRLEETTGHPAQTIHRLLKLNSLTGEFVHTRDRLLDVDLVLIDEASMVDLALMNSLLEALPEHCALILVGDADQLPPVGAGSILQSMIQSERFTIVRLKDIFRQSAESLIKINAQRINAGHMPLKAQTLATDFHYLPVHGVEEAKNMIFDLATRVIPQDFGVTDLKQVQILTPLNGGPLGTQKLNQELQLRFTGLPERRQQISGYEQQFKTGDKVMVIKNDYAKNIFNGDLGFIRRIDYRDQVLDIEFDDRTIRFGFDELDRLTLAYAISIHKAQGSEYRAVIVVLAEEHLPMAQRHLIYTAVTRGKEQVFLVAEPKALKGAVESDENNRRWQKLTEILKA